MGEILQALDYFGGISDSKIVFINGMILFIIVFIYVKFKISRHPRYRLRILFVEMLILLDCDLYFFDIVVFERDTIYFYAIEVMIIAYVIISAYKPVLTFFLLKRVKILSRGGFRKKCDRYFEVLKYLTITTASKLEYKILLADDYERRHLYIKAYNTIYYIADSKKLFETEKDNLETYLSYYAILMGNVRLAKEHIEKVGNKVPMSLMVEMKIGDVGGESIEQVMEYVYKAESMITRKTPDGVKAQIYANYGNCRMLQGNFEDALFNVKRALQFAKKAKNKTIMNNIYEQLIILLCNKNPKEFEVSIYLKEYLKFLKNNEPSNVIRMYNFMSRYYRMQSQEDKLLPLVANNYLALISKLEGCERYNWEISNLDVAQQAGIHIKNIMRDVKKDFPYYYNVDMPDRFFLINTLHRILEQFFVNDSDDEQYREYRMIFEKCENYIAENAYYDLKKYYEELDGKEIYERCRILKSMVAVSAMSEWHNRICVIRYDKLIGNAYCYKDEKIVSDKSEHIKRVNILIDIAGIYNENGLMPMSIDAYINIIEECYSVYIIDRKPTFDINIIDSKIMEKYLEIVINKIEESKSLKRFQAQLIHIAAQLCVLGKYTEANKYYKLFDKKELKDFNSRAINYYRFTNEILKLQGYM